MLSSKLLFALCETIGKGNTFVSCNYESKENEDGTIAAFMHDICYQLTAGRLSIGAYYLLSETPLQIITPDVIFTNEIEGSRTSMFGYIIDDVHKDKDVMP